MSFPLFKRHFQTVTELGLKTHYIKNKDFKMWITMLMFFPFLMKDNINEVLEKLDSRPDLDVIF